MKRKFLALSLFFAGLAFLLYPQLSHVLTNRQLEEDIAAFHQSVSAHSREEKMLEEMFAYNRNLQSQDAVIEDVFTEDVLASNLFDETDGEPDHSKDLLNQKDDPFYFVVSIPKIDVQLPVYIGASDTNLLRGAAQVSGSSLPIGGPSTHSVIAAHRGTLHHAMFLRLERLDTGDTFEIHTPTETLLYKVTHTQTIYPKNIESLQIEEGKDLVTLVTCLKFPFNDRRLLVHGERVN